MPELSAEPDLSVTTEQFESIDEIGADWLCGGMALQFSCSGVDYCYSVTRRDGKRSVGILTLQIPTAKRSLVFDSLEVTVDDSEWFANGKQAPYFHIVESNIAVAVGEIGQLKLR